MNPEAMLRMSSGNSLKGSSGGGAPPELTHQIVLDYLRHSGRTKAVRQFQVESDFAQRDENNDFMMLRGRVRRKILAGDIVGAIELINDLDCDVLDTNSDLFLHLKLQAFVEMVRTPGYDLETVLNFATIEFVPCPSHLLPKLELCMALLAFENPLDSPLKEVFNRRHRLACEVNNILMRYEESYQRLGRLIGSAVCMDTACSLDNGKGPVRSPSSDSRLPNDSTDVQSFFSKFL